MPSIPPITSTPTSTPSFRGLIQPNPRLSAPRFGAVTASDTIQFGGKKGKKEIHEHDEDNHKHGLRLWDRTKASTIGALKGLFVKGWGWDIGISLGIFALTLPLALLIPGSHFVLIPGYIGLARAIRGTSGLLKGLVSPDKILKPDKD